MNSFSVIPAIDVLEGRCVRLSQGRRESVMVEGGDPAAAAARFVADGARYLHLVDLDGAFSGRPSPGLVEQIVAAAGGVPIQAGGGLRNAGAIESALAAGASRAIVGYYQVLNRPVPAADRLRLRGLDPDTVYRVSGWPDVHDPLVRANAGPRGGDDLMSVGLSLGADRHEAGAWGDFGAWLFVLEAD